MRQKYETATLYKFKGKYRIKEGDVRFILSLKPFVMFIFDLLFQETSSMLPVETGEAVQRCRVWAILKNIL